MNYITRIVLSNTKNPNQTVVCTRATPESIHSNLLRKGWSGPVDEQFVKDGVVITVTKEVFVTDVYEALNLLSSEALNRPFFS